MEEANKLLKNSSFREERNKVHIADKWRPGGITDLQAYVI
jgi:hypothetical protein